MLLLRDMGFFLLYACCRQIRGLLKAASVFLCERGTSLLFRGLSPPSGTCSETPAEDIRPTYDPDVIYVIISPAEGRNMQ
jgi:hypothetical protein